MTIPRGILTLALLLAGLAFAPAPAKADPPPTQAYAGKVSPLGYCQLSVGAVTAVALSSCTGGIPTGAITADIVIESASVRYRDDPTAPTTAVGMPIAQGNGKTFTESNLAAIKFIAQSGTATLDVSFY